MRSIMGIVTTATVGAVGILTIAVSPALATEGTAESQKRLDLVLEVLGVPSADVAEADVEVKPTARAVAKPKTKAKPKHWKHATGDLPRGKAVPLHNFWISAVYGNRGPHTGGVHGGLDFAADTGEPIFSVAHGRVIYAGWQGSAGNSVTLRTKSGKYILYGHMSKVLTRKGMWVKAGQRIGRIGSTGNSTGPHLHLQVQPPSGRGTIDPLPWLGVSKIELGRFGRD